MPHIYDTDLTDEQWANIEDLFPPQVRYPNLKKILSVFNFSDRYFLSTKKLRGQCRMLPKEYPPFDQVNAWHVAWEWNGLWEKILARLRDGERRRTACADGGKRTTEPVGAILDNQSVKTTEEAAKDSGFDGGKKIEGRRRHVLVDALGFFLTVAITPANVHDTHGARQLLASVQKQKASLHVVYADKGYRGPFVDEMQRKHNLSIRIVHKTSRHRFEFLAKRWIVSEVTPG